MQFVTWNVNGLRAALNKGVREYVAANSADFILLQEVKSDAAFDLELPRYRTEWASSARSGYAGVVCLFKKKPLSVSSGLGVARFDADGRVITLEYPEFYVVNVYVPQSQGGLARWYYRLDWDEIFYDYTAALIRHKPVIIGGDFNVAHEPIDTYHTEPTAGFREEERGGFDKLLALGLVDTFRHMYPDACDAYTWWSGRDGNRAANRGRRLDYFLVSETLASRVKSAAILADVQGSDHAPITLEVAL